MAETSIDHWQKHCCGWWHKRCQRTRRSRAADSRGLSRKPRAEYGGLLEAYVNVLSQPLAQTCALAGLCLIPGYTTLSPGSSLVSATISKEGTTSAGWSVNNTGLQSKHDTARRRELNHPGGLCLLRPS